MKKPTSVSSSLPITKRSSVNSGLPAIKMPSASDSIGGARKNHQSYVRLTMYGLRGTTLRHLLPMRDECNEREARADHLHRLFDPIDEPVAEPVGAVLLGPVAERQLHHERAADVDRARDHQPHARPWIER